MTDGSGVATQRMSFDEYGMPLAGSDPTGEQFRYTGRRFDPETGLYYYRARYYSPLLGRFLQTDPVGYMDDLNLYGYVGNDPLDRSDPSGLARVCVEKTGSRIPSCVGVDGNGDGNTKDNDLTKAQIATLSHDFRSFIASHNGSDLSKSGAEVFGDGANSDNGNFVRATSQFVGSANGGWNGVGIEMGNSETMRFLSADPNVDSESQGIAATVNGHKVIGINTDSGGTFAHAGNTARVLLHEFLHLQYPGADFTTRGHQWIDSEARRLLKTYGLGDGGCDAVGGLFGTDWFASYPACK
jgi:RHS repeat-associated protein